MITGKNLEDIYAFIRETDKVLYDIQQTFLLEHPLKESIELGILRVLIATINRLPLHETIFAGSNCTGFRSQMIAHYTDSVVNKHRRDLLHVVS